MSSAARCSSAAFNTVSGAFFSMWRIEKYISRWRCAGNHGFKELAFSANDQVNNQYILRKKKAENCRQVLGVQRTSLAFAVEGGKCCEGADQDGEIGQRDR